MKHLFDGVCQSFGRFSLEMLGQCGNFLRFVGINDVGLGDVEDANREELAELYGSSFLLVFVCGDVD
ncbi:hypothetical protein ACUH9Y_02460 [Dermabacteraceae bacterium P13115]